MEQNEKSGGNSGSQKGKKQGKKRFVLRVRHKIILWIYLVLFVALITAEIFFYYRNRQSVMVENSRSYQATVQTLNEAIAYVEQDIEDLSLYFCVNDSITRLLESSGTAAEADPLFWTSQTEVAFAKDILAIKNHIRTLILYPENGLPPFYVSKDASAHVRDIEVVRGLDIYDSAVEARGDIVWDRLEAGTKSIFDNNRNDKVLYCREIFDLSKQKRLAFLAITVDLDYYERLCEGALLDEDESILLVSDDGGEIASAGQLDEGVADYIAANHPLRVPPGEEMLRYEDWYIFSATHGRGADTVYYLSPVDKWNAWILSGLEMPILLAVLLLVCIWPISALASSVISRPLSRLNKSMDRFKQGDFTERVAVRGQDEIAELSATFNDMVRDLKDLIERNYVMVLRERESELDALQAQINPHFLYNALDSLYWQATESGQEELSEDILSLSQLFRLTLSSGQGEIPVRQEMDIIKNYLHIQKMRFAKKLDYRIEVEEAILDYRISKLVLQPFVENAIVHGLERKDTWGFVSITGQKAGDALSFAIEDNGAGMSPEQVETILYENEDKRYANQRIGHYAIRNVKERLALRYGQRYHLTIESEVGRGTVVRIQIPLDAE